MTTILGEGRTATDFQNTLLHILPRPMPQVSEDKSCIFLHTIDWLGIFLTVTRVEGKKWKLVKRVQGGTFAKRYW